MGEHNYRTFDRERFVTHLRNSGFEDIPVNVIPPDCCWDQLSKMIIDTLDQMAPLRTSTFRKDKPEWLTAELIEIMKDRDQALKLACRTKNLEDKRNARKLRNLANKSIKSAKSEYLLNKLDLYQNDPKKFWQTINEILPRTKSSEINLLSHQGAQMSDKDMSEEINDFFANMGAKLASEIPQVDDTPAMLQDPELVQELIIDRFVDADITRAAKSISVHKSSGITLIASRIWIILYKEFTTVFTKLYNKILATGCYPNKWKIATVIPIPKVTNATSPNDLRPISLLPLPGKILEHLIQEPLMSHLEYNHMIDDAQNGFRPKRSTIQTVFQFTSDLYQFINSNLNTTAVYIDFRKAFDPVSHSTLIKKLKTFKLSAPLVKILENYLANRQQHTQINNTTSTLKSVPFGVPQGSVLGPTLFIMYINDVVKEIKNCSIYLYADDMVIYTPLEGENSLVNLQHDLDRVLLWCNKNKLTININKTKAQLFPRNSNIDVNEIIQNNQIKINNVPLHYKHHFRYLGIELNQMLTMKNTCDQIYKNASHKLHIYRLIRGSLTMSAAIQILKAMFVSILDYGNVFLTGVNQDRLSDLQKLQNDAVRCCLNIKNPRDAHVNDLHERLHMHLLDHRRTIQLLTCIRKSIKNGYLDHIAPEDAVLRNQSLKVKTPIPRNDTVKKSPYYWGSMVWNRLPQDIRLLDDLLQFKKLVYCMLMDGTLRTDFII